MAIEAHDGPAGAQPQDRVTAREAKAEWEQRLAAVWREWAGLLPGEAATSWTRGAAYVRHSSARSLHGEAPDAQLRRVLALLADKRVYVPEDAVFFDVESATEVVTRGAFKRLFEAALGGGFKVVGAFVNERLFRNLEQAIQFKREFRLHGIELEYLGRYEGDRRNPAAWQLETMQDMTAEYHARNTGFYVGTHIETLTRAGRPVGMQPEVFLAAERAPSFMGRRGSVIRWEVQQPLARIMQDGCRMYLDGASFADLAEWAAGTELKGVTPAGHQMDKRWWYYSLRNPKLAGYQMPTTYTGFKPGRESPPRPRRNADSELVKCNLPALWPLEDYRAILALGRKRWSGGKWRRTYQSYLLSGIAYDARCGCRVWISERLPDGGYRMGCGSLEEGEHGASFRADIAAAELDALLGTLAFDDPALVEAIEQELRALTADERRTADAFVPNPQIAKLREVVAVLAGMDAGEARDDLRQKLAGLEALDDERRMVVARPVVEFRHAIAQLQHWSEVWRESDTAAKNKLLVEAGVRVHVGPLEDHRGAPAHVLKVSAENDSFSLALAAALSTQSRTLGMKQSSWRPNVRLAVPLGSVLVSMVGFVGADGEAPLPRPTVGDDAVSLRRFAALSGLSVAQARRRIARGRIAAERNGARPGERRYWRVPLSELARLAAEARDVVDTERVVPLHRAAALAHRDPRFVRALAESGAIRAERAPGGRTAAWLVPVGEVSQIPPGYPRPNRARRAA